MTLKCNQAPALISCGTEGALALRTDSEAITYTQLIERTDRMMALVGATGCKQGERVLLMLPDSAEFIVSFLACLRFGVIPVLADYRADSERLKQLLNEFESETAIVCAARIHEFESCLSQSCRLLSVPESKLMELPHMPMTVGTANVNADDPAVILFTSGTTGLQKPVVHTYNNIFRAIRNVGSLTFGLGPSDKILCLARSTFAFGLGFGLCFPLALGATVILPPPKLSADEIRRVIAEYRPTIIAAVPSVFAAILTRGRTLLDLSSVRLAISAGEPLSAGLVDEYLTKFEITLFDGIGSTELFSHFITNRPGLVVRAGSCGTVVAGCEARLVDDGGADVADGQPGNLLIKSESAFLGYWRNPKLSSEKRNGDWVITGDRFVKDFENYYYYRGRIDDQIKLSGQWVAPHEVETLLNMHPGIERTAVILKEGPQHRRELKAYIVAKPGHRLTDTELLRYLGDRLESYMIPQKFVELPAIPLNANGKIDRAALTRMT